MSGTTATNAVRAARTAGRSQARNLFHVLRREAVATPPLDSATLDRDDVEVARAWLRHPAGESDRHVVSGYEAAFARWNGSGHAFAFASGREALSAALEALALRPGDEVILPAYTCFPVANAVRFAQLVPVFADIELATYGLDADAVRARVTERTRAILVQHLYGLVSRDTDAVVELARRRGLAVIQDCAHATGAEHHGRKVGNAGDVAVYSSHYSKVFNTSQGGIAATNDPGIAERLDRCRERAPEQSPRRTEDLLYTVLLNYYGLKHPQRWWLGDVAAARWSGRRAAGAAPGEAQGALPPHYGARMAAPIAALGLNQLQKLDGYNRRRRAGAARWDAWCDAQGLQRPLVVEGSVPVFLRYPVLVEPSRKRARRWAFEELRIDLGTWFESPPSGTTIDDCPSAALAYERCVNFPTILDGKAG